jgi:uncharacterized protein YndB with AHSA1/START domain
MTAIVLFLAVAFSKPLVVEATIDAPPAVVWNLFTTKERLESWMAAHADADLRIGGAMRAVYDPKGALGDPHTIVNTILAYEPERMLTIKATGPPEGFPYPASIASMWTVIYFEPVKHGRTHMRVVSLGIPDDDEGKKLHAFFERGNRLTMEHLQKAVNGMSSKSKRSHP